MVPQGKGKRGPLQRHYTTDDMESRRRWNRLTCGLYGILVFSARTSFVSYFRSSETSTSSDALQRSHNVVCRSETCFNQSIHPSQRFRYRHMHS
ncbi:hypothetical protein P152DRAFT_211715 [Eremomyces bilateralis CBS 781.70]|uniref:Uncharacterized protein n=1 Tax=Eremomyces bilateralis CBS 781.70 TaxID=1392243 RepID=A0A6G1FSE7_9PEZI|nr:uncharacterized protein P152DRAFT_211715 [Eremomyces bilateralis CBS 781.70]KAF1808707.1 hypothetical protein P152DRAFT_211715 [Eremomyces bilateralis CBS 781.70]